MHFVRSTEPYCYSLVLRPGLVLFPAHLLIFLTAIPTLGSAKFTSSNCEIIQVNTKRSQYELIKSSSPKQGFSLVKIMQSEA